MSWKCSKPLVNGGIVYTIVSSPTTNLVASGHLDGSVRLWLPNATTAFVLESAHSKMVFSLSFSPDGKTLASGSVDGSVKFWDVKAVNGQPALSFQHKVNFRMVGGSNTEIWAVGFSCDGSTLYASDEEGTIREIHRKDGSHQILLQTHKETLSLKVSSDGKNLFTGHENGQVVVWSIEKKEPITTLETDGEAVWAIATNSCTSHVVTASSSGNLYVMSPSGDRPAVVLKGHTAPARNVMFVGKSEKTLVSVGDDRLIIVWQLSDDLSSVKSSTKKPSEHTLWVRGLTLCQSGDMVATASDDGTVRFWSLAQLIS